MDAALNPTWLVAGATAHRKLAGARAREDGYASWAGRELRDKACKLRDEHGTRVGISGMARGGDMRWAQAVLAAGLDLWAYVPFPQQPQWWSRADKAQWRDLLHAATLIRLFSRVYEPRWYFVRNDGILADSDVLVAVYDPSVTAASGTFDTFVKATGQKSARPPAGPVILVTPTFEEVSGPPGELPLARTGSGPSGTLVRPVVHVNPASRQTRLYTRHLPRSLYPLGKNQ
jgi:hypothetical protein